MAQQPVKNSCETKSGCSLIIWALLRGTSPCLRPKACPSRDKTCAGPQRSVTTFLLCFKNVCSLFLEKALLWALPCTQALQKVNVGIKSSSTPSIAPFLTISQRVWKFACSIQWWSPLSKMGVLATFAYSFEGSGTFITEESRQYKFFVQGTHPM